MLISFAQLFGREPTSMQQSKLHANSITSWQIAQTFSPKSWSPQKVQIYLLSLSGILKNARYKQGYDLPQAGKCNQGHPFLRPVGETYPHLPRTRGILFLSSISWRYHAYESNYRMSRKIKGRHVSSSRQHHNILGNIPPFQLKGWIAKNPKCVEIDPL